MKRIEYLTLDIMFVGYEATTIEHITRKIENESVAALEKRISEEFKELDLEVCDIQLVKTETFTLISCKLNE